MFGLFTHFGHPHPVIRSLEARECRAVAVELIAQYNDEVTHGVAHDSYYAMEKGSTLRPMLRDCLAAINVRFWLCGCSVPLPDPVEAVSAPEVDLTFEVNGAADSSLPVVAGIFWVKRPCVWIMAFSFS